MTFRKKILGATLLSASLMTTPAFAEEDYNNTAANVVNTIIDGTKIAATVVAETTVKTYEFVKPYAGAAWDSTKDLAVRGKDAVVETISEVRQRSAETPTQYTPVPIEHRSLSQNTAKAASTPSATPVAMEIDDMPSGGTPMYDPTEAANTSIPPANVESVQAQQQEQHSGAEADLGEITSSRINDPMDQGSTQQNAVVSEPTFPVGQHFVLEDEYLP